MDTNCRKDSDMVKMRSRILKKIYGGHAAKAARAESLITEAMKSGKFDNLPGKGKPLDPDSYSSRAPERPRNVDQLIGEAIRKGEFDNLPGKGKPLDLDTYFKAPEHLRMAFHILKGAGFLPPEIQLRKQIEDLREERNATGDEKYKRRLDREINEKTMAFDIAVEKNRRPSSD